MLRLLLERPGDVVTREEIRQALWSTDTIVEFDHGIGTALKKLRQALGDAAATPHYIETLPRRGFRWLTDVAWVDGEPAIQPTDAIAVLPFVNLSADKENEHFGDGLAEEILNALSAVKGLRVTARTSAFAFRGKPQDVRVIGAALGVDVILEGSVRRAGARIRVTAQLVSARDGYHLWSERYDRELTDLFAVQDQIAQAIVGTLTPRLVGGRLPSVRRTANLEAYDAYLRGRHHASTVTPESAARATACFAQAIALDPRYAPAYSGLARCLFIGVQFGSGPPRELMPQVKAAAQRAVELDQGESEAHAMLALVAGAYDYDWAEALRRCRLALACEPVSPIARHWCAQFILLPLRRSDEAIAVIEPLLAADPLAPLPRKTLADALFMSGHDRAPVVDELQRLIEWDDGFWLAQFSLGNVYAATGMTSEAVTAYQKGLERAAFPPMIGNLAGLYAREGDRASAERLLERLAPPEGTNGRTKTYLFFHLACSEFDCAAVCLRELIEARDPDVIWLGCDSRLQNAPPIRALLETMHLADPS